MMPIRPLRIPSSVYWTLEEAPRDIAHVAPDSRVHLDHLGAVLAARAQRPYRPLTAELPAPRLARRIVAPTVRRP